MVLIMAEMNAYQQVHFSAVDAIPRDGFAQYQVSVRGRGRVLAEQYYLNRQGGVWVPAIDTSNRTVAFGDTEEHAFETLRAQRIVLAERKEADLARFRENTEKMRGYGC